MSALIQVQNLSKSFSGFLAIQDINFEIQPHQIVGLLGLNGAGKSTILKILGTFLLPSSGEVTIDGLDLENSVHQVRERFGYLPDTPPLYDEMEVEEYLIFVCALKNVTKSNRQLYVDEAIHKTNLKEVRSCLIRELSHGFRQRVGIAQAIVHKPKLIILDEPINGLDPVQIVEMRDLILSLKKDHTVLLSSHILSEITKTCDQILIIDRGRLVAKGTQESLLNQAQQSINIRCEVKDGEKSVDLSAKIKNIPGCLSVKEKKLNLNLVFEVHASSDLRPQLARLIIHSEVDLLSLTKTELGLENVFMKIVQNSTSIK